MFYRHKKTTPLRAWFRRRRRTELVVKRVNCAVPIKKVRLSVWTTSLRKAATYSPTITAVPSAQIGLTSLFGMGRGEPYCYNHLKFLRKLNSLYYWQNWKNNIKYRKTNYYLSLRVISTTRLWHYCLYTYSLSTW